MGQLLYHIKHVTRSKFHSQYKLSLTFTYPAPSTVYTASVKVLCLQRIKPITIAFEGSGTTYYATASLHALQQIGLFKD